MLDGEAMLLAGESHSRTHVGVADRFAGFTSSARKIPGTVGRESIEQVPAK